MPSGVTVTRGSEKPLAPGMRTTWKPSWPAPLASVGGAPTVNASDPARQATVMSGRAERIRANYRESGQPATEVGAPDARDEVHPIGAARRADNVSVKRTAIAVAAAMSLLAADPASAAGVAHYLPGTHCTAFPASN